MNEEKYLPNEIEKRAQEFWEKLGLYQASDEKIDPEKDLYVLDMFPYPSGEGLHVGHVEGYTATDIYSRYKRMNGFNVLHPMGWDAFGLPAENTAIKLKTHPSKLVEKNVARFKAQLKKMGFSYDWSREINTTDPEYYKWTQWIFLKLFHLGLAYEAVMPINWCPSCKTGLANEEVVGGKCERCGTDVEKKNLRQWVLRITKYADRLLQGLDDLDWPEGIKELQRNWIGKKEGINITYKIKDTEETVTCFTTRPDTNFGATFVVISPEHSFAQKIAAINKEAEKYVKDSLQKSDIDRIAEGRKKTGVFTGFYAINDLTKREMPIWISDFVLGGFGTGAVVGVPGHDKRDFEFAKEYNIPVIRVVVAGDGDESEISKTEQVQEEEGKMINSEFLNGLDIHTATEKIMDYMEQKGMGKRVISYKLRDWLFSRQRYWGEPIPVVHCDKCAEARIKASLNFRENSIWDRIVAGEKTVETRALNPEEPERYFGKIVEGDLIKFSNKITDESRLFRVKRAYKFKTIDEFFEKKYLHEKTFGRAFSKVEDLESVYQQLAPVYLEKIKKNGLVAWEIEPASLATVVPVPEDQLPVLLPEVENYEPTGTGESPLANIEEWVNTACPKCGGPAKRETNTMPQWAGSCWYFLRFADPKDKTLGWDWNKIEKWLPVNLYVGGAEHAVLHLLYARFWMKALYDGGYLPFEEPFFALRNQGTILGPDGQKMSKSRGNVINPDDIVDKFGADALRIFEMFLGPFEQNKPWDDKAINGVSRFLYRIWKIGKNLNEKSSEEVEKSLNKLIKKVGDDIEGLKFNTAISSMMEFVNLAEKQGICENDFKKLVLILAPFAPHLSEYLWQDFDSNPFSNGESVTTQMWPQYDEALVNEAKVSIVIQVNGKVRATLLIPKDVDDKEVQKKAQENEVVKKWLDGKKINKVIFVKNRLINFVIE